MTIEERKITMIKYLKLKLEEEDWHGVMDAAADLRELEVEKKYAPIYSESHISIGSSSSLNYHPNSTR